MFSKLTIKTAYNIYANESSPNFAPDINHIEMN